jgi:hypothetical protein
MAVTVSCDGYRHCFMKIANDVFAMPPKITNDE